MQNSWKDWKVSACYSRPKAGKAGVVEWVCDITCPRCEKKFTAASHSIAKNKGWACGQHLRDGCADAEYSRTNTEVVEPPPRPPSKRDRTSLNVHSECRQRIDGLANDLKRQRADSEEYRREQEARNRHQEERIRVISEEHHVIAKHFAIYNTILREKRSHSAFAL